MGRPRRIVLLRHCESEANADPTIFERTPDHAVQLNARGFEQARAAGLRLRALFGDEDVEVYLSPYLRARQTLHGLGIQDLTTSITEEPRLREQDWGNLQDIADIKRQRVKRRAYGQFFYRFTHGESGADVYDRVTTFLETLHRQFNRSDFPANTLLVTHGLTMRLFCMRWFHWTVEYFESLRNPANGETRMLLLDSTGRYTLDRPFEQRSEPSHGP
jgi:broad specificity phosphatase PhoE